MGRYTTVRIRRRCKSCLGWLTSLVFIRGGGLEELAVGVVIFPVGSVEIRVATYGRRVNRSRKGICGESGGSGRPGHGGKTRRVGGIRALGGKSTQVGTDTQDKDVPAIKKGAVARGGRLRSAMRNDGREQVWTKFRTRGVKCLELPGGQRRT